MTFVGSVLSFLCCLSSSVSAMDSPASAGIDIPERAAILFRSASFAKEKTPSLPSRSGDFQAYSIIQFEGTDLDLLGTSPTSYLNRVPTQLQARSVTFVEEPTSNTIEVEELQVEDEWNDQAQYDLMFEMEALDGTKIEENVQKNLMPPIEELKEKGNPEEKPRLTEAERLMRRLSDDYLYVRSAPVSSSRVPSYSYAEWSLPNQTTRTSGIVLGSAPVQVGSSTQVTPNKDDSSDSSDYYPDEDGIFRMDK